MAYEFNPPKGSAVVFDKSYNNYRWHNTLTEKDIYWVTRIRGNAKYDIVAERRDNRSSTILYDKTIKYSSTQRDTQNHWEVTDAPFRQIHLAPNALLTERAVASPVEQLVSALTQFVYYENIHCVIDLNKIIGFDWDGGNARKNHEKHNVNQTEAEQVFFNEPLLLLLDEKHSNDEVRYHAYGKSDHGRKLHIAFTLRHSNTLIRIISARGMHRKEKMIYEQAQENTQI